MVARLKGLQRASECLRQLFRLKKPNTPSPVDKLYLALGEYNLTPRQRIIAGALLALPFTATDAQGKVVGCPFFTVAQIVALIQYIESRDALHKAEKQKLVDTVFSVSISLGMRSNETRFRSESQAAQWVATQLRAMGFYTKPVGSSWGVL